MIKVGIATVEGRHNLFRNTMLPIDPAYNPELDTTFVASLHGRAISAMHARPMMWVHGLITAPSLQNVSRMHAVQSLFNYALGWSPAAPRLIAGHLFQVALDNDSMVLIARSLDAVEEENARLYRIDL